MHRVTTPHPRRAAALALVAMLAIAACSGSTSSPSTSVGGATASPGGSPSAAPLSGDIAISGSSTVQPISQTLAEMFNDQHPDVAITVDGPGTGDGFKLFCAGDTDISDASRKIKEEEAKACADKGIEFIELKVAIDGMSILTSINDTTGVDCLSFADLYALVGPESEGFDNWKDGQAIATALGSKTTLPDAPLEISGPGEESGTYDYFVEKIVTPLAEARGQDPKAGTRKDYNSNPNDNVIVEGIAGTATSLGWVGYAFAQENTDKVKHLSVDKGDGKCIEPTAETIASNQYPLSRDLYIYVNKAKAAENEALTAFVDFYLAEGTIAAANAEVGYIDLAPEVLEASRSEWATR
jgi:phosphate transport system substrate-binding protein